MGLCGYCVCKSNVSVISLVLSYHNSQRPSSLYRMQSSLPTPPSFGFLAPALWQLCLASSSALSAPRNPRRRASRRDEALLFEKQGLEKNFGIETITGLVPRQAGKGYVLEMPFLTSSADLGLQWRGLFGAEPQLPRPCWQPSIMMRGNKPFVVYITTIVGSKT